MEAKDLVGKWVKGWEQTNPEYADAPALVVGYNMHGFAAPNIIVENLYGWGWEKPTGSDVVKITCEGYSYANPALVTVCDTPEGELDYDTDGQCLNVLVDLPPQTTMSQIRELEMAGYKFTRDSGGWTIKNPEGVTVGWSDTLSGVKP